MSDFDIAYSSLTESYYFVIDNNKYDITDFVDKKIQQGREDVIDEMIKKIKSRKGYFEEYYPNDTVAIAEANVYLEIAEQIKEQKNERDK